jgi:hypothetical protein
LTDHDVAERQRRSATGKWDEPGEQPPQPGAMCFDDAVNDSYSAAGNGERGNRDANGGRGRCPGISPIRHPRYATGMRAITLASIIAAAAIVSGCRNLEPPTSPGPPTAGVISTDVDDVTLAQCPTAAEIAGLNLDVRFEEQIRNDPLVCTAASGSLDLSHRQLYIYTTLLALQRLTFTEPLPWTDGQSLWQWFSSFRPRIAVMTSGLAMCSPCSRTTATLVIPVPRQTAINWTNVARLVGAFAHEARHIEVGGHPCGTRDQRVDDLGAFGVHNLTYAWIADYLMNPEVPAETRSAARGWACEQRNSAFCNDRCGGGGQG